MGDLPRDERYIRSGTMATVGLAKPDEVQLYLQLTMSPPEWRHLMRQLPSDGSAAGQLGRMISQMLGGCLARQEKAYATTGWSGLIEPTSPPRPALRHCEVCDVNSEIAWCPRCFRDLPEPATHV
jgi:hypothetical protein